MGAFSCSRPAHAKRCSVHARSENVSPHRFGEDWVGRAADGVMI